MWSELDKHLHQRKHEDIYIRLSYDGLFSGPILYKFRSEAYIFRPMVETTRNLITVLLQSNDLDRISAPDTVPGSKHYSTFFLTQSRCEHESALEARFEHSAYTFQLVKYGCIALCSRLRMPFILLRSTVLGLTGSPISQELHFCDFWYCRRHQTPSAADLRLYIR